MCNDSHIQIKSAMLDVCNANNMNVNVVLNHYYKVFRRIPAYFVHHHLNQKLMFAQVSLLILIVQSYARELTPMSTKEVACFIERHFGVKLTVRAVQTFLKHHPQFVHGHTKPISVPRTNPALIVDCDAFATQWDALIATGRVTPSALVTFDETVIGFNAGK